MDNNFFRLQKIYNEDVYVEDYIWTGSEVWVDIEFIDLFYLNTEEDYMENSQYVYIMIPEGFDLDCKQFTLSEGVVTLSEDLTVKRNKKLDEIRAYREPLLVEVDYEINKLYDINSDDSLYKAYRKALRDVTNVYKTDMTLLDAIEDAATDITWPTKP